MRGGIAPPFVLQVYVLSWLLRSKLPVFVYEHTGLTLDVHFHVKQSVIIHVLKTQGDGGQLLAVAKQGRDVVNPGADTPTDVRPGLASA